MKDGIYFNLPAEEYHAQKRLTSTGIKNLLISPTTFWFNSAFNPLREEKKTKALDDGTIYHKILLEGSEALQRDFVVMPESIAELNKNTSTFKLWKSAQPEGALIVDRKYYNKIKTNIDYLNEWILPRILTDGYAEVSILWTDKNGIKKQCRFDYLKRNMFIDLKTFEKNSPCDIKTHAQKLFYANKTFIQLQFYRSCEPYIQDLPVFGTPEQEQFIKELDLQGQAVLYVDRNLPHSRFFKYSAEGSPNLWQLGEESIARAERLFLDNLAKFGECCAWLDMEPLEEFLDVDFPQSFFNLLEIKDYE